MYIVTKSCMEKQNKKNGSAKPTGSEKKTFFCSCFVRRLRRYIVFDIVMGWRNQPRALYIGSIFFLLIEYLCYMTFFVLCHIFAVCVFISLIELKKKIIV